MLYTHNYEELHFHLTKKVIASYCKLMLDFHAKKLASPNLNKNELKERIASASIEGPKL